MNLILTGIESAEFRYTSEESIYSLHANEIFQEYGGS